MRANIHAAHTEAHLSGDARASECNKSIIIAYISLSLCVIRNITDRRDVERKREEEEKETRKL